MENSIVASSLTAQKEERRYRWYTSIAVVLLFVLGSLLNVPFSREVKRLNLAAGKTGIKLSESVYTDLFTFGLSSLILGAVLVFIGLWVASRAQLGAPLIKQYFSKVPLSPPIGWNDILKSLILSSIIAVVMLGLFELQKAFHPVSGIMERPAKPFYFLVAFSAGITEEIMFRLGLMSLFIAAIQVIKRAETPSNGTIWAGIIVASVFFGLIHLPLSKNFVELTPFTIGVTMVGNFITGSTFGWIFWKRGLLVAILSHITFDLVFHVLGNPYH
ncbi:MAG: CPBP family intramembrane metalloprotease [Phaeodactylibacter sp.]|nr:CPBP family intramembrane metalloprotease [Phaeodactylibacter sp.]